MKKYFSTNYSDACKECAQAHTNTLKPMYIYVFAAGGLLSALLFSLEGFGQPVIFTGGFCPPCHFHGRALFVRLVIFGRESFCPGGLLTYTQLPLPLIIAL
jgi:hypothetical protein